MIRARLKTAFERGYLHFFASNLAQQVVAFATVLAIARLLPEAEFAVVRIAQAYLAVLLIVGVAGVTAPVLRYGAEPSLNALEKRQLLGHGLKIALLASVLFMAGAWVVTLWRFPADSIDRVVFLGYAAQLPTLAVFSVSVVFLQSIQQFQKLAVSQLYLKLLALFGLVGGAYFHGLQGLVLAALAVSVVSALFMLRMAPPVFQRQRPSAIPHDFNSLARYSVFGMLLTTLGQSSDLILLDALAVDKSAVGSYSLASVFLVAAGALVGTAQSVATPMFTALMGDPPKFRRQLRQWSVGMFGVGMLVAALLVGGAWVLKPWFFGERYAEFPALLSLLMAKFVLWSTYAIGGAAMLGIGAIKQGSWIAAVTTALAFAAGVPLIWAHGVWGAAWAQVIVAVATFVLVWWVIRDETRRLERQHQEASARGAGA